MTDRGSRSDRGPVPTAAIQPVVGYENLAVAHHAAGVRELIAGLTPATARRIQARLEPLLIDDPELVLSLRLQLDQVRAGLR